MGLKDGVGRAAGKLTLCDWLIQRPSRLIQRTCNGLCVFKVGEQKNIITRSARSAHILVFRERRRRLRFGPGSACRLRLKGVGRAWHVI